MPDTFLERTHGNSSPNGRKGTISVWVKRTELGSNQYILGNYNNANNYGYLKFDTNDNIAHYSNWDTDLQLVTNMKFRDLSGWYHIVLSVDTTQSTASDRLKLYVNGVEPSYSTTNYGNQNTTNYLFQASASGGHRIGSQQTTQHHFGGLMSHFHFIDGTAYPASTFGSTDSTTGEWKINTNPTVTYGSQGYFMFKNDNSLSDDSGNGNNFIVGNGTLTKSEDNPSNVFSTMNFLNRTSSAISYTNGNTTISYPGTWVFSLGNMGVSSGKWYWEAKVNSGNNANSYYGICAEMVPAGNGFYNNSQNGAIMYAAGDSGDTYIDGSYTSGAQTPQNKNTDILGLALDLDSGTKTLKIYKNGTQLTSGGTVNLSSYYNDTVVFPCFSGNSSSASCSFNVNFGNGYFGTTAVSSAGTNASGNGIFEFDVPAGYTAISTKGLNL